MENREYRYNPDYFSDLDYLIDNWKTCPHNERAKNQVFMVMDAIYTANKKLYGS